jgi:hypothetical protein
VRNDPVWIGPSALGMYYRDLLACHEVLDELGVPRLHDDEKLSLSQRLKVMHDMLVKLNVAAVSFNREVLEWRAKHG